MVSTYRHRGFTLVELIMVIVLMGIIAGVLAPFIHQAVRAYVDTQARTELAAKGRLALERLNREVRQAVPNSLQVTGGGSGIEFVSSREGGRLVAIDDDFGSAFAVPSRRFAKGVNRTRLYAMTAGLVRQPGDFLVIGNTSPAELRSGATRVVLTDIDPTSASPDGTERGQILLFPAHRFPNDSPGRHFQIAHAVHEICLNATTLNWRRSTGFAGYDNSCDADASDPVLVDGVASASFSYDPGTPESSGVLRVALRLSDGQETVRLYHEIHVRNTP